VYPRCGPSAVGTAREQGVHQAMAPTDFSGGAAGTKSSCFPPILAGPRKVMGGFATAPKITLGLNVCPYGICQRNSLD